MLLVRWKREAPPERERRRCRKEEEGAAVLALGNLDFREMCFRLGLPIFNEISKFYFQTKKDLIGNFFKNTDMTVEQFFFFFLNKNIGSTSVC